MTLNGVRISDSQCLKETDSADPVCIFCATLVHICKGVDIFLYFHKLEGW